MEELKEVEEEKTEIIQEDAEVKTEETPVEKPEEKTELQLEVEKLRGENQGLKTELGRVPELNSRIDKMTNQINELIDARQMPSDEGIDDEYVTSKKLKEVQDGQEAAIERVLVNRDEKTKKWNDAYTGQVAKLSIDITDDDTLTGILNEMDSNFRDDSIKDPVVQAEVNYAKAKASFVTKAMSAGKQVKFASNNPAKLPLGVGSPTGEKPIERVKKEVALPQDAKELLKSFNLSPEKEKELVGEALS